MNYSSDYIIGRNIELNYIINNNQFERNYQVEEVYNKDILSDIINILTDYNVNNWGLQISDEFVIDKKNTYSREQVQEDLTSSIKGILDDLSTLKLTK